MSWVVLFIVLLFSFGYAEDSWLYSADSQKDNFLNVNFRKRIMDDVFSRMKINWEDDGIYFFRENGDSLKLVILKNNLDAVLYQKPSQNESRWKNPELYLEERKKLKNVSYLEECMEIFSVDSSLYLKINTLPFSSYPVIIPRKADEIKAFHSSISLRNKPLFMGFKKNGDNVQYFFFRDFRNEQMELSYPLDSLSDNLQYLQDKIFFKNAVNCK